MPDPIEDRGLAATDVKPGDVLLGLDSSPSAAAEQIRLHYDGADPQAALLGDLVNLLAAEGIESRVTESLAGAYWYLDGRHDDTYLGPLAFYLALTAAWTLASEANDYEAEDHEKDKNGAEDYDAELLDNARSWLMMPDVLDCVYDVYGLPRDQLDLTDAELHRIGTTSLILRCKNRCGKVVDPFGIGSRHEHIAVKLLLPRYFRVVAVREQTAAYKKRLRDVKHDSVPPVAESAATWIIMAFVEGRTLHERLRDERRDRKANAEPSDDDGASDRPSPDLEFIRAFLSRLCDILRELLEIINRDTGRRITHLDLSPSNVILVGENPETGSFGDLRLIDFGHNFTVLEQVGSSAAVHRTALYIDPELEENPERDDWRSDAYSLGMILLELAARRPLEAVHVKRELDRLWQGDKAWDGAPGLARIVEELIDRHSVNRLLLWDPTAAKGAGTLHGAAHLRDPYGYVKGLVRQEIEVEEIFATRSGSKEGKGFGFLKGIVLVNWDVLSQVRNLLATKKLKEKPTDDTYADYPTLGRWAGVAVAAWAFTVLSFVYLTFVDLGLTTLPPTVKSLIRSTHAPFVQWSTHHGHEVFKVASGQSNLPGRLVALTFGLVSVTYYVNNFSRLSFKRAGGRTAVITDRLLRISTVLLPIPVLWAMVWDPSAWPLCSGIGTLLVVLNNYLTLRLARAAIRAAHRESFSTVSDTCETFINENYSEWWRLMGYYSLAMIVVGVLLAVGRAGDAPIFAALVVAINVVKVYRLNCVAFAPKVHGWLSWVILTLRRGSRAEERREQAGSAARSADGVPVALKAILDAGRPLREGSDHLPTEPLAES